MSCNISKNWLTDRLDMTKAVDWDVKPRNSSFFFFIFNSFYHLRNYGMDFWFYNLLITTYQLTKFQAPISSSCRDIIYHVDKFKMPKCPILYGTF